MTILLPYQKKVIEACERHDVVVIEKSRRIGITWTIASFALFSAANGTNVYYLGYNLDMTRDFIHVVNDWAKGLDYSLGTETLFLDEADKEAVQALKIQTKAGARIHALTSKPRSLRGKQGIVIIDEAAFHDDLDAVMAAALPLLMLGGKVIVMSTHFGKTNTFYAMCEDIRQGRKNYHLIRITFADAIADGYYKMVCARNDEPYSQAAEEEYVRRIRDMQTHPAQELDCIALDAEGAYFSRVLLEKCADETIPVLRWQKPEGFDDTTPEIRKIATTQWIADYLDGFDFGDATRFGVGMDIGRDHDLSVIWVFAITQSLIRKTALVIELAQMFYDPQIQIIERLLSLLPQSFYCIIDKGGLGDYIAESLEQKFGNKATGIALNRNYYAAEFPRLKAAFEDGKASLPADHDLIDDLYSVAVINGLVGIPKQTGQKGRHADGAVACLLAFDASNRDTWQVEYYSPENAAREDLGEMYA